MLTNKAETTNAAAAGKLKTPMILMSASFTNQIGTEQKARHRVARPHIASLARTDRTSRHQTSQIAKAVRTVGINSSEISPRPRYRLKGPGEWPIIIPKVSPSGYVK